MLGFVTAPVIRYSGLCDGKKKVYLTQLNDIKHMLETTKPFGQADWPALVQWQQLSEDFYCLVGIEGVVVGDWSNKAEINQLGEILKGLRIDKPTMRRT